MKPTEKMFSLLGGKIEYDFHFIKFKINFPAKDMKDFFGGFHRKVSLVVIFKKKYVKSKLHNSAP